MASIGKVRALGESGYPEVLQAVVLGRGRSWLLDHRPQFAGAISSDGAATPPLPKSPLPAIFPVFFRGGHIFSPQPPSLYHAANRPDADPVHLNMLG
jgi:hypothetical protein